MSKRKYLNELHNYLFEKEVIRKDIDAVISDYAEIYDEAIASGFSHEAVVEKLGQPKEIYQGIKDTLHFDSNSNRNKIFAIMPFIATIMFFAVGFGFDGFSYAWAFYLLIPITAILVNVRGKERFIALTPFISVIVFFLLGFFLQLWHPGWLIFLLIPVTAITLNTKGKDRIVALSPFPLVITYVVIVTYVAYDFYLYGWAIFALIPLLALILKPVKLKDIIMIIAILAAVGMHLTIYFTTQETQYAWLPYLFPALLGILLGYVQVITNGEVNPNENKWVTVSFILIILIYLIISFLVGTIWTWSWIMLLLIPMIAVYDSSKFEHPVAYVPFICVITFMLLGMLGGYWNFAWMVFLLIPITAILTEGKSEDEKSDVATDTFDESSED